MFHARRLTRWLVVGGVIGALVTWSLRQLFPEIGLWIVKAFVFRLITVNEPVARMGREMGVPFLGILFNNALVAAACYAILPISQWLDPQEVGRFPRVIRRWALSGEDKPLPWMERAVFWVVARSTDGWFLSIKNLALRRMWALVYFLPAFILGLQGFYTGVVFGLSDTWIQTFETGLSIVPHGIIEFPALMVFASVPLTAAGLVRKALDLQGEAGAFNGLKETREAFSTGRAVAWGGLLLVVGAMVEFYVTPGLLAWWATSIL